MYPQHHIVVRLQGCLASSWSCVCFVVDLVDSPSLDFRIVFFREIVDFMQRVLAFFLWRSPGVDLEFPRTVLPIPGHWSIGSLESDIKT